MQVYVSPLTVDGTKRAKRTFSTSDHAIRRAVPPDLRNSALGALVQPGLAFRTAGHQVVNGCAGGLAVMQDGVHLLGDGHLNPVRAGQFKGGVGGENAFRYAAPHAGDDLRKLAAAAQFDTDAAVAGKVSGAGQNQV